MTGQDARPPRWLTSLLILIRDEDRRELIAGDLEEGFQRRLEGGLVRQARRWYASQVLRSIVRSLGRRGGGPGSRRSRRSPGSFDGFIADVRDALRGLRAQRRLTLLVTVTLALGLGVNTAMLAIADAVLFRPLPYPEPDRLLWIHAAGADPRDRYGALSYEDVVRLREASTGLGVVGGYSMAGRTIAAKGAETLELDFARVTPGFFDALGVRLKLGRSPTDEEIAAGLPLVVLSHDYWLDWMGGNPGVLSQTVRIRGVPHEVVGVANRAFTFPAGAALWRPLTEEERGDDDRELRVIGRLAPGAGAAEVNARLAVLASAVVPVDDETGPRTLWAEGLRASMVHDVRTPVLMMLGGAWLVLLIACANVANLLLARGEERRRQLAMRAALGARRSRLVRLQLIEVGILAVVGGVVGVAVGAATLPALVALAPAETPRIADAAVDLRVLTTMLGVILVTTLLAGGTPALGSAFVAPLEVLAAAGRGVVGLRGTVTRRALVVVQVALSTVLANGAVLLIGTVTRMAATDPGFDPESVVTVELSSSSPAVASAAGGRGAYSLDALETLRGLAGVKAIGLGSHTPGEGRGINAAVFFGLGLAERPASELNGVGVVEITPGYIDAAGLRLIRGRPFSDVDHASAARVAIVNRRLVATSLGGDVTRAIGERLAALDPRTGERGEIEIVGVVEDVRPDPRVEPNPLVYVPYVQSGIGFGTLVLEVSGDPASVIPNLKARLQQYDAGLPLNRIAFLDDSIDSARASPAFLAAILIAFGSLALGLALVGGYSVASFGVTRRSAEFAIRRALGAPTGQLMTIVFGEGATTALMGVGLGVTVALAGSRLVESLLFGVDKFEPAVYAGVAAGITFACLAAAYLPARRAARADPMRVLRDV